MMPIVSERLGSGNGKHDEPVLKIRHLYKSFGDNHVLINFNMDLFRGENVVVLGKSGSGKSVLIKCIIGLIKPDRGMIEMFGRRIPELIDAELNKVMGRVGFLFQSNALYDSMTVRENLEFPLRRHRLEISQEEVNIIVMEALEDVGLGHTLDLMPAELSGGMRKRVALARTLILKPEIILYDEPTTGLDPVTAKEIIGLMLEIQKKYNTSSIIISHDMNCLRLTGDRVIVLMNGTNHVTGTYQEIIDHEDMAVKEFFE